MNDAKFKALVLNALSFLLARHCVMGTSDRAFFDKWQSDMSLLSEELGPIEKRETR